MPEIEVIEVGPRDGLQNEKKTLSLLTRKQLIKDLIQTGIRRIEVGACVSPHKVPQMAQSAQLAKSLGALEHVQLSLLVANELGLDAALSTPVQEIAVFTACSDAFTQANIGCNVDTSIERFTPLVETAKTRGLFVRGYLSTIVRCPYQGNIKPKKVMQICHQLLQIGCDEIALGETLGVATPAQIKPLLHLLLTEIPANTLALHCHDTYGQALVNVATALDAGIEKFDASIAGLGGCPFAKGASGNLATEDLIYFLQGQGLALDINLHQLATVGKRCCQILNRMYTPRAGQAVLAQ